MAPSAPASTAEQDALWALAPANASTGIVVSPRGLDHLERAFLAIRKLMSSAPDLAPLDEKLARALEEALGTRAPDPDTLGMTAAKGLANALKLAYVSHGAFPKGSVGPTPARSCCTYPSGRCDEPAAWSHPIWKQLDFAMQEPHFFRYTYDSDGTTFMLRAIGDLDCDGNEITYTLSGSIDDRGNFATHLLKPEPDAD